jgi:hypothetical protein
VPSMTHVIYPTQVILQSEERSVTPSYWCVEGDI